MSVATSDSKVTYQGNGAAYTWPFSFPLLDKSRLRVILTDAAGKETTLSNRYRVGMDSQTVVYPVCNSGGNETRMKNIACDWLVYAKTPTVRIVQ